MRRLDAVGSAEREVHQPAPAAAMMYRAAFDASVVWSVTWFSSDRLDQLRLGDRSRHLQDRLLRVDDAALRDRPDLAGEPHASRNPRSSRCSNPIRRR